MLLPFVLLLLYSAGYLSAIQLPQPGNQANVATGTTNLMITATMSYRQSSCSWKGTGLTSTEFYFSAFGSCQTVTSTATHNITCTNIPGGYSTSLTYLTAMTSNTSISLSCDSAVVYSLSMIVKECSSPTSNNVPVNPSSGVFNTQANFQCSHGSTLFYINGTTGNTATKCLATAEWENEKIVQCWSAPTATLIGNNTIWAGNIATFQCNAAGGVPSLDRVEIYFNNQNQTLVGNTWTSNPLSSSNNGDIVECRAINSYTAMQEYSNLGRDSKTLIIHYAAEGFAVNDGTTSHSNICTWYIAPPGPRSCTITFSLNPTTYTTTLTKDGAMVTNDATNQPQTSTSQTFVFTRNQPSFNDSGNYTLRINNGIFENTFTFNISVINEVQPTTTITTPATSVQPTTQVPTTGGTSQSIPPPDNLGVIIGAVLGVVGALILIIILVYRIFIRPNKKDVTVAILNPEIPGSFKLPRYVDITLPQEVSYENLKEENIDPSSTNYENMRNNVSVQRDEEGYVELKQLDPCGQVVTSSENGGYETAIVRVNKEPEYVSIAQLPQPLYEPINPPP
uniref:uncharacterized protein LOC100180909 n=1 Tax=Ciona intestinalis TaxID=7719 RepID=UPI00089DCCCD|nr:uncharacterized protein LOC100180909 [Ciona intestinalis]|eukprot:XP_018671445.1 uncharacterized protein LOC100180909 [Ciona intestinalis]